MLKLDSVSCQIDTALFYQTNNGLLQNTKEVDQNIINDYHLILQELIKNKSNEGIDTGTIISLTISLIAIIVTTIIFLKGKRFQKELAEDKAKLEKELHDQKQEVIKESNKLTQEKTKLEKEFHDQKQEISKEGHKILVESNQQIVEVLTKGLLTSDEERLKNKSNILKENIYGLNDLELINSDRNAPGWIRSSLILQLYNALLESEIQKGDLDTILILIDDFFEVFKNNISSHSKTKETVYKKFPTLKFKQFIEKTFDLSDKTVKKSYSKIFNNILRTLFICVEDLTFHSEWLYGIFNENPKNKNPEIIGQQANFLLDLMQKRVGDDSWKERGQLFRKIAKTRISEVKNENPDWKNELQKYINASKKFYSQISVYENRNKKCEIKIGYYLLNNTNDSTEEISKHLKSLSVISGKSVRNNARRRAFYAAIVAQCFVELKEFKNAIKWQTKAIDSLDINNSLRTKLTHERGYFSFSYSKQTNDIQEKRKLLEKAFDDWNSFPNQTPSSKKLEEIVVTQDHEVSGSRDSINAQNLVEQIIIETEYEKISHFENLYSKIKTVQKIFQRSTIAEDHIKTLEIFSENQKDIYLMNQLKENRNETLASFSKFQKIIDNLITKFEENTQEKKKLIRVKKSLKKNRDKYSNMQRMFTKELNKRIS